MRLYNTKTINPLLLKLKRSNEWIARLYSVYLRNILLAVDWKLLGFLILFLNVKMAVKVSGIVLIYLLQPDIRFGFKIKNTRLPLFYLIVIGIAIINWIIGGLFLQAN